MEPRLFQNQSQRLILSPQIRQYLRLLQMPLMELAQAVDQEMTDNPLLEEKSQAPSEEASGEYAEDAALPPLPGSNRELQLGESFNSFQDWDSDYSGNTFETEGSTESPDAQQKKRDYRDSLLTKKEALSDYLIWQIRFAGLSAEDRAVAEHIIGNINEQGFLQATLEEMAAATGKATDHIVRVLEFVQQLEPAGIAARNLQEALVLQLKRLPNAAETALAIRIVNEQLSLLEKRDWNQIAKIFAVSSEEVRKAADLIKRLEPRPGRSFYSEEPIAITPDALVYEIEAGTPEYKIEITHDRVPELRVNSYYRNLLKSKDIDDKTREFLKEKLQAALTFMKAVSQRKSTIHQITEQIVKEQHDFFEKGFSHLKPLRLKDVAANLNIHESTVSRAIHGKYMQTPQGTIPYRSFFSTKLDTISGEAESQKSIMEKIKKLIHEENPFSPLSDQDLVGVLKKDGLIIARRTVAKYRDLLKILPSHLRRQK